MVLVLSTRLRQLQTVVAQGRAHLMSRLAEPDGTTLLAVKRLPRGNSRFRRPHEQMRELHRCALHSIIKIARAIPGV